VQSYMLCAAFLAISNNIFLSNEVCPLHNEIS
jgi:hypothetical protein